MSPLLLLVVSYLLGAIPSSYLVGRGARGIDLREYGSGNLGASNTYRVLGTKLAIPVLLFDLAKGWFPASFFPLWDNASAVSWAPAYAAAAVIGHVLSIWVGFRGGKGVATSAGALLALAPAALGIGLLVWIAVLLATRIVSLASILTAVAIPPAVMLTQGVTIIFWLSIALAGLVIVAHRANILRLVRGEEHRFVRKERVKT